MSMLICGRRLYLYTRPDGTTVSEKPNICRRIFPETNAITTNFRSFGKKEIDSGNIEKWKSIVRNQQNDEETELVVENAKLIVEDFDDILNDSF